MGAISKAQNETLLLYENIILKVVFYGKGVVLDT